MVRGFVLLAVIFQISDDEWSTARDYVAIISVNRGFSRSIQIFTDIIVEVKYLDGFEYFFYVDFF